MPELLFEVLGWFWPHWLSFILPFGVGLALGRAFYKP